MNLAVAKRVVEYLGNGARLTRNADFNLSLGQRADIARQAGAKVFVSIHGADNSAGQGGTETWVHSNAGPESWTLAQALHQELYAAGASPRAVAANELAVLSPERLGRGMAACMVEIGDVGSGRGAPDATAVDRVGRAVASAIRTHIGRRQADSADGVKSSGGFSAGMSAQRITFEEILNNALKDPAYRDNLLRDVPGFLRNHGLEVPPEIAAHFEEAVRGHVNTAAVAVQGQAYSQAMSSYISASVHWYGVVIWLSPQAVSDLDNGATLASGIVAAIAAVDPELISKGVAAVIALGLTVARVAIKLANRGRGTNVTYFWINPTVGIPSPA